MTFLEKVIGITRKQVSAQKDSDRRIKVLKEAERTRSQAIPHKFRSALQGKVGNNIIAEIKRSSPSKGVINKGIDVADIGCKYEKGGAVAISVLTEETYFSGSLDDLRTVRRSVGLPLLRKDFLVDEYQIFEAAAAGADCVLLIVAALAEPELKSLLSCARQELGMDALVEVHDERELVIAENTGADIIGVNNRDLNSLEVSLETSRRLIRRRPKDVVMVAESGLSHRDQLNELRELGFHGFLIGETLMRSEDPSTALRGLV